MVIGIFLIGMTSCIGYFYHISKHNENDQNRFISHKKYDEIEYWKSVENIIRDDYLREISDNITLLNKTTSKRIKCYIIPIQIDGKNVEFFTPEEFYEEYGKVFDGKDIPTIENEEISITYSEKIKIKSVKNIKKEHLEYKSNKKTVNIKSIGEGLYVVELEVNKDDLFYMLFK